MDKNETLKACELVNGLAEEMYYSFNLKMVLSNWVQNGIITPNEIEKFTLLVRAAKIARMTKK